MSELKLTLSNIAKRFDNYQALVNINLKIHKGEIVGFLGPSGAGKTTTIKIVTGQLKPTEGTAKILGEDSTRINEEIYRRIGIVSDNSGFYEKMTVFENLNYFAKLLGVKKSRIDELLEKTGLAEHQKKQAAKLSRGQTQRLVLARSIIHQPEILFLDEPTSGLDPSTALAIHQLLLEQKQNGMSIFLTTHNMDEAAKLCDKVALIDEGQVKEFGTPKELCLKYNTNKKYQITLKNKEEIILADTPENLAKIASLLTDNQIETIHSAEPTLEKVFLKVTGKELR